MEHKSMGTMISSLRKGKGMTQLELAALMNVTDKAVSKWERDISCPDINSIPTLAEALDVSVEELMQSKNSSRTPARQSVSARIYLVWNVIPFAMGAAVVTLSLLNSIDTKAAVLLLGIGMISGGLALMHRQKEKD